MVQIMRKFECRANADYQDELINILDEFGVSTTVRSYDEWCSVGKPNILVCFKNRIIEDSMLQDLIKRLNDMPKDARATIIY